MDGGALLTDLTTDGLVQSLRRVRVFQRHFGHVLQRDAGALGEAQRRGSPSDWERVVWIHPDHGADAVGGKLTEGDLHGNDVGHLIRPTLIQQLGTAFLDVAGDLPG